jgi:shikimate dehydrogenase
VVSQSLEEICCCIAQPVGGIPAQYLMEKAFLRAGLEWRFLTFEIPPQDLADAVRGMRAMRFRGAIIASPHRAAAIQYLDELTDQARIAGVTSGVTRVEDRLVGDIFTGKGFVAALSRVMEPAGKSAVVLGGGDVAREVAVALAAASVGQLTMVQPAELHDEQLLAGIAALREFPCRFAPSENGFVLGDEVDILIQAAADSAEAEKVRWLNTDALRREMVVADAILRPADVGVVRQAAAAGCRTINGLAVAVHQAAVALEAWSGAQADTASLHEALEEFLGV